MFQNYIANILNEHLECTYYFVEVQTNQLVYLNDTACDILKIPQGTYEGLTCYELLHTPDSTCPACHMEDSISSSLTTLNVEDDIFSQYPYRHCSLINKEEKEYLLVVGLKQPMTKALVPGFTDVLSFDQGMIQAVTVMLNDGDPELAIQGLLEIGTSFYCATECALLEKDPSTDTFSRTYRHIPSNYPIKIDGGLNQSPADLFKPLEKQMNQEKFVFIKNIKKELDNDSQLYKILKKEKISSFLLAPIEHDSETTAYLFIENPMTLHMDLRFLHSMVTLFQEGFQKRQMGQQLENVYDFDLVTGFLNQKKYLERLEEITENLPDKLGIVFVDLLKEGHKSGSLRDEEIQNSASVMESYFQEPFYRVNQNQFVCFMTDIEHKDFVEQVDRLQVETSHHEEFDFCVGHTWEVGADTILWQLQTLEQLMHHEPENFEIMTQESHGNGEVSVQKDLLQAIESQEFAIFFQPKFCLSTKKVVGAEALVRRQVHHEGALVAPGTFVQLYEDQAIIRHLDLYVVEQVCKNLAIWKQEGIAIPISVNFSRVTLTEYGIVETICEICDRYEVPHHLLAIEFTERIAMMNQKAYHQIGEGFQREGFLLSLDDFGAAYSNLITLAKINLNEIKIDRALIRDMEEDKKNQIILKSIIEMCHVIEDIDTLAEGIETEAQANMLCEFGCKFGQGNYFSPAIPIEDFYKNFLCVNR